MDSHAHMRFPDTEEVTGSIPVSPTHETRKISKASKTPCVTRASRLAKIAPYVALVALLALAIVLAVGMHQRANAAPVQPTWQQSVVTIDDEATVAAAQAWGAPFAITYAAQGADITVSRVDLSGAGKAGGDLRGEAEPVVEGDRIVGCVMRLDPVRATVETVVHEFGHCLGLGHLYTAKSRSLMVNGGAEDREHGSATVTDFDRAALADLYEGSN